MKEGIHPDSYRMVVFKDMSNGHTFLSRSTAASKEMVKWEDGNEYPLIKLEISNTSHPFLLVKICWLIWQVVLISLKRNTPLKNKLVLVSIETPYNCGAFLFPF